MIVYKVVEKDTRYGSNWTMFKYEMNRIINSISTNPHIENAERKMKKQTIVKRWKRTEASANPWIFKYLKGTIVTSYHGSIGILTFETYLQADNFRDNYKPSLQNTEIIKVIGVERLLCWKSGLHILPGIGSNPGDLKEGFVNTFGIYTHAPDGTIAFRSVEVLE